MNSAFKKPAGVREPLTYTLGLIGYPLGHSLSPQIHKAALQACGLKGEYQRYPVRPLPDGAGALVRLLDRMRGGLIDGLNVTIPHKEAVLPLLDELTPAARAIGAVNTIFWNNDQVIGDNTDAPGFWKDLTARLKLSNRGRPGALILGAGGSARAAAYALLSNGYRVTIAARRLAQAEGLCSQLPDFRHQISAIHLSADHLGRSPWSLIVNTTPVGMHPHPDASPWPPNLPFPQDAEIYDLVYNPPETTLVKDARDAGLNATIGLGMLIEQAALAFERWTGVSVPRMVLREAVSG
jgi:shikimate dehydrogenase